MMNYMLARHVMPNKLGYTSVIDHISDSDMTLDLANAIWRANLSAEMYEKPPIKKIYRRVGCFYEHIPIKTVWDSSGFSWGGGEKRGVDYICFMEKETEICITIRTLNKLEELGISWNDAATAFIHTHRGIARLIMSYSYEEVLNYLKEGDKQ